jgi:hypothetical protein
MSTTKIKVSNISAVTGTGNVVLSASPTFTGTVSGITKAMVGLDNVDNTTDLNKPVSTLAASALLSAVPLQTGNSGKYLTTNGTITSWSTLSVDPMGTAIAMAIALG